MNKHLSIVSMILFWAKSLIWTIRGGWDNIVETLSGSLSQEAMRQKAIKDAEKERANFYAKQKEGQKDVRAKYREKVKLSLFAALFDFFILSFTPQGALWTSFLSWFRPVHF